MRHLRPHSFAAFAVAFILSISGTQATAQNRSAGGGVPETEFDTKHINHWAGERFVFLEVDPALRHYGYLGVQNLANPGVTLVVLESDSRRSHRHQSRANAFRIERSQCAFRNRSL